MFQTTGPYFFSRIPPMARGFRKYSSAKICAKLCGICEVTFRFIHSIDLSNYLPLLFLADYADGSRIPQILLCENLRLTLRYLRGNFPVHPSHRSFKLPALTFSR
jgi:hypothetical protein